MADNTSGYKVTSCMGYASNRPFCKARSHSRAEGASKLAREDAQMTYLLSLPKFRSLREVSVSVTSIFFELSHTAMQSSQ